jgi:Tfp pilus assembly protein PilO
MALDAVLLLLLFRFPARSRAEQEAELRQLREEHAATQNDVRRMRDITRKLQTATRAEQDFSRGNFLSQKTAFSTMLSSLEELAAESHLKPSDAKYQLREGSNPQGWAEVQVSLALEGSYENLVMFINRLERSQLFWIIQGLNLSGAQGQQLRLSLQLETYLMAAA